MSSEQGKIAVLQSGGSLEPIAVNDLGDDIYATPAISDGKIYVRTRGWLYCFGTRSSVSHGSAAQLLPHLTPVKASLTSE